jgi:hypothetical protein
MDRIPGGCNRMNQRVLYLFICGAGPASRITDMVTLAHAQGWSVYCIATPAAVEHFLDIPAEELRQAGIRVLFGHGEFEPHPPRTGGQVLDTYPWSLALKALTE